MLTAPSLWQQRLGAWLRTGARQASTPPVSTPQAITSSISGRWPAAGAAFWLDYAEAAEQGGGSEQPERVQPRRGGENGDGDGADYVGRGM